MNKLINNIKNKRLIFSVTTGRSGTKYLAYVLSLLKGVHSEHEDLPGFHEYFRTIREGNYDYKSFWLEKKLPYVSKLETNIYSDVSHVACKGFFESLLEMDIKPSLIILKRNNRDVAKSLWKLNTIPNRTTSGLRYLLSPNDSGVLKIKINIDKLSDYQLCYWYTLEIERRQKYYENLFLNNGSFISKITFEDLIVNDGIYKIKNDLSLPGFSMKGYFKYIKNKGTVLNDRLYEKRVKEELRFKDEEEELKECLEYEVDKLVN